MVPRQHSPGQAPLSELFPHPAVLPLRHSPAALAHPTAAADRSSLLSLPLQPAKDSGPRPPLPSHRSTPTPSTRCLWGALRAPPHNAAAAGEGSPGGTALDRRQVRMRGTGLSPARSTDSVHPPHTQERGNSDPVNVQGGRDRAPNPPHSLSQPGENGTGRRNPGSRRRRRRLPAAPHLLSPPQQCRGGSLCPAAGLPGPPTPRCRRLSGCRHSLPLTNSPKESRGALLSRHLPPGAGHTQTPRGRRRRRR